MFSSWKVDENNIGAPKMQQNFVIVQYCDSNIGQFYIAFCKAIALNLLCNIGSSKEKN